MRNKITIEEIIKNRIGDNKAADLINEAKEEIEEIIWGGRRKGAGRKPKEPGKVLKFAKRLTEKEAQFIDYARAHNINYDDLMQG